jgi:hypothetical protein
LLQAVLITTNAKKQLKHPNIPSDFVAKILPGAQQRQPVQLKFTVDGTDSTPAGEESWISAGNGCDTSACAEVCVAHVAQFYANMHAKAYMHQTQRC